MSRVLIVDDSQVGRQRVMDVVSEGGHEIEIARNGQDALDKVASWTPDCVVTDLMMPVMTGTEFLDQLRKSGNKTPVIVVTADMRRDMHNTCIAHEVSAYLSKPLDAEVLAEELAKALGRRATLLTSS